jgi:hypothetical protein
MVTRLEEETRIGKGGTLTPDFFREMDELMAALPRNKHSRLAALIAATIDRRGDTFECIRSAAYRMGFDHQHFGMIISGHTGDDPDRHLWNRDADGRYRNFR